VTGPIAVGSVANAAANQMVRVNLSDGSRRWVRADASGQVKFR
jgi:hypothetical protein